MLGAWLDQLGVDDVRLERQLAPWPGVCMLLGAGLVVASLPLMLRNAGR